MNLARCPVCCADLKVADSGCSRCQTPHHADCFSFMGGCAVFGCGGKAFGAVDNTASASPLTIDGTEATPERKPAPVFQRGIWERIQHSWRALYRNAPLALGLALILAGMSTVGALLLGRAPLAASVFSVINQHFVHAKSWSPLSDSQLRLLIAQAEKREKAEAELEAHGISSGFKMPHPGGPQSAQFRAMLEPPYAKEPLGVAGALGLVILLFQQLGFTHILTSLFMIIALVTRARGKTYSVSEIASIALPRFGRAFGTGLRVWLWTMGPLLLAGGGMWKACQVSMMYAVGWLVVGPAMFAWMLYSINTLMLAHVVAAMGRDDEPGDPLARSREIVRLRPWHTFFGFWANGMLIGIPTTVLLFVVLLVPGFTGLTFTQTVLVQFGYLALLTFAHLSSTFFLVLVYIEGRRQLEPGFMPFASTDGTGAA